MDFGCFVVPSTKSSTQKGYTFTTPYLVNGLAFAGKPDYLSCVVAANFTMNGGFVTGTDFPMDDELCEAAKVRPGDGRTNSKLEC